MRNIFVLGFFMMAIALCNGVSEGSGGDLVVITPTNNKSAPPTDSTDDSGSGDDDEDDDDDDGSTTDAPTKMATTKMATTKMATTKMATTVTTTGTTTKATTKATTTIAATTRGGDDEGSGGSGSGSVSTTAATKSEPVTDDIYISEGTSTKPKLHSTVKTTTTDSQSLPKTSSTDSIVVYDTTTTTKTPVSKAQSTTAAVSTTATKATTKPTTMSTTPLATTQSTTRNSNVVGNTLKILTQRKSNPSSILVHHTTETPTKKIIIDPKTPTGTTQKVKEPSTTAKDVDALALNQKKSGDGFTLTTEVIAGVVGCALLALLFIAFLMYRLKKRDEGSYLLDDSCGHPDAYKKVDNSDKEAFV